VFRVGNESLSNVKNRSLAGSTSFARPARGRRVRATFNEPHEKGQKMRTTLLSTLVLVVVPAVAHAQDPAVGTTVTPTPGLGKDSWPLSFVDRPLGLSSGMVEADVLVNSSFSKGAVGKPVNLPIIAYFGVTDQLQLAVSHSTGLCVSGKDNGCATVYDDARLTALYSIFGRGSNLEIAGWAALNFGKLDPATMQAVIGPAMNWVIAGNAALLTYPGLAIGLNKRGEGNKQGIEAPTTLYVRAGEKLAPYLYTNLISPLEKFGDNYAVPLGVGAIYGISTKVDVGGLFQFTKLVGGTDAGVDGRALTVYVNVRPL
jgi:hypothetical protein